MMKQRVVVLGATGMLGSMLVDHLVREATFSVVATVRSKADSDRIAACCPGVRCETLDATEADAAGLRSVLAGAEWAVNAIGIIKPYIHDDVADEVERAILVNALFPHRLAQAAESVGCRMIQIATDCVYSGKRGDSTEAMPHDPHDVYGKTKSLGEVRSSHVHHLRCSILGPEWKGHRSLLHWFLRQPRGATVSGYTNHQWNGVTTLQFAEVVRGIVLNRLELPQVHHLVPSNAVSKHELLGIFAEAFGREDVTIAPSPAAEAIDRTLATTEAVRNDLLWKAGGYGSPPTIEQMVKALAAYDYRMGDRRA